MAHPKQGKNGGIQRPACVSTPIAKCRPLWSKLTEVQGAPPSYGVNVRKFFSFRRSHSLTPSEAEVARKYLQENEVTNDVQHNVPRYGWTGVVQETRHRHAETRHWTRPFSENDIEVMGLACPANLATFCRRGSIQLSVVNIADTLTVHRLHEHMTQAA